MSNYVIPAWVLGHTVRRGALIAVFLLVLVPAARADFQAGVEAYERGDYAAALEELVPLAKGGDAKAVSYITLMAEKHGIARAQDALGSLYLLGQGVPQDRAAAVKWTRKAAEQGFARAQEGLGLFYYLGQSMPRDHAEAARWFRAAAEQGHVRAQFWLGGMYANGRGVVQDYSEAARWYRKAAEQGDAVAQWRLGKLYQSAKGVPQDLVLAHMWLNLALAKLESEELRDEVRNDLVQLTMALAYVGLLGEAQRMAREWEERHRTEGQQ